MMKGARRRACASPPDQNHRVNAVSGAVHYVSCSHRRFLHAVAGLLLPHLFSEVRFGPRDFAAQPHFSPSARSAQTSVAQNLWLKMPELVLMGVLAFVPGAAATGRLRPM
ncbi:protein of unknown function (plasmid) [Cupriavidus taiwanensis]|nr:protein of unknown function [Cupriavidus taiwanensis]